MITLLLTDKPRPLLLKDREGMMPWEQILEVRDMLDAAKEPQRINHMEKSGLNPIEWANLVRRIYGHTDQVMPPML